MNRTHIFLKKDRNLFLVSFAAALLFNYAHCKLKDRVADWLPEMEPVRIKPMPHKSPALIKPPISIVPSQDYFDNIAIAAHETIRLPSQIKNLNHYELHQLSSPLQEGPSCGWYTIMNAKAIQEIIACKEPFSAHAVKKRVYDEFIPMIRAQAGSLKKVLGILTIFSGLTSDQIARFARHMKVNNYYAIDILEGNHRGGLVVGSDKNIVSNGRKFMPINSLGSDKYFVHQPQELLSLIKQDTSPVIHLLLAVPCPERNAAYTHYDNYHAVLISIINRPRKKPLLLYFDSNNDPLGGVPYKPAPAHGKYVCDLIAQLDCA